jgi:hypothetical protein
MPTPETLQRFIARVMENAHAEAIEEFYVEDASMQENRAPPRIGKGWTRRRRRRAGEGKIGETTCVGPVFVSGDNVVVRIFDFEWLTATSHMESSRISAGAASGLPRNFLLRSGPAARANPAGNRYGIDRSHCDVPGNRTIPHRRAHRKCPSHA